MSLISSALANAQLPTVLTCSYKNVATVNFDKTKSEAKVYNEAKDWGVFYTFSNLNKKKATVRESNTGREFELTKVGGDDNTAHFVGYTGLVYQFYTVGLKSKTFILHQPAIMSDGTGLVDDIVGVCR